MGFDVRSAGRQLLVRAAVFAAAMVFVAQCAPPTVDPIVLKRSNGAEPDSLDPQKSSGTWENNIIGDMILGLMTEDAKGNTINGSAESYTVSEDGLIYTFHIRQDMTWSDGVPVTADDFVFAFQRILDPKTAAQYASLIYAIKNAEPVNQGKMPTSAVGARAVDSKTLEVTLEAPTPYFINLLTHHTTFPVPKHIVEKFGDAWVKPQNIQVNGAYKLADWEPNNFVRLVKNPKFYDAENVQIEEVYFYPLKDSKAALQRFRSGELDATNDFPTREYGSLKGGKYPEVKASEVRVYPYVATNYVQFNTLRKPFDDPKIRRAISLAIDREVIAEKVLGTGQVPAYALVPPGMANYDNGPQLDFKSMPMDQRREEAKKLLAAAGYGPGNPLKFTYKVRESVDNKRVAVALQAMWKEVGMEVEIFNSETAVHYNSLRMQDFDVADAGWVADYNDPQNYLFLLQSSSGQMNYGKYSNPKYDALMDEAATTIDLAKRATILKAAEKIELDEQPLAPIFYSVSRSLVRDRVKGWEDNTLNWHRSRFMWIAPKA